MRKVISLLLSILLLLTVLPAGVLVAPAGAEGDAEPESAIINVKDFGAVGDGKTDDEAAIWAAFECALMDYMVKKIPVTVYFPEGQYGLKAGGLYVYLPRGAGDLTIKGDGADKSTIVYLDEWTNAGSWVALRIYPKIKPESLDQYLHDITIQDLGVYDTNPEKHAWHVDKGDPNTEETHGFNIQHCVRATIKNCKVESVGDEALDMTHCVDSLIKDNVVINSPGAGNAGGGISVGDGSKNVLVTNNTIIGSIDNPNKTNWAIAVEALSEPVEEVEITNNVIRDINGWGVNIGVPNGSVDDVWVHDNTITDCRDGGVRLMGNGQTTGVKLTNNYIANTHVGVGIEGANKIGTLMDACTIENLSSYGVSITSSRNTDTVVQNVIIRNAECCALYNAGTNTLFDRVLVDGSGTAGDVTDSAVAQYAGGGSSTITNSILLNCRNKKAIQGVAQVINTYIDQPEVSGYTSVSGAQLIQNCWVNRIVTPKSGCIIDGLTLYATADLGNHAIGLSNLTDCTVTNCRIVLPSYYGIIETGTANNNTITNNVVVGGNGIQTIGADTVVADNAHSTLSATEQFNYYVVDGEATIVSPVLSALPEYVIPAAIADCPVTTVDPWAFALCDSLTSVEIPAAVTTIGHHAFYGCDSLTDVHYLGSADEWDAVTVGEGNGALLSADLTVDYVAYVLGDANGDGKINNRDLGTLQRYLNDLEVTVCVAACDLNSDGKVNNRDLGLLQRQLNQ